MKIEIKNYCSNAVIFAHEQEGNTLAITVRMALAVQTNLRHADLSYADLSNTELIGADLSNSDLSNVSLCNSDLSGADLSNSNLSNSDLSNSDLSSANLSNSDLSNSDLRYASLCNSDLSNSDLSYADLRYANLRGADLRGADLTVIRDDIWAVLSSAPREVPALIDALKNGGVDGSTYTGACSCLVGTIATARGVPFDYLKPNSSRPAERFFLGISKGDTPETNQASALAHQWASEWLATMQAAFSRSAT